MRLSRFLPHLVFFTGTAVFVWFSGNNFVFGSAVYFPLYTYLLLTVSAFIISRGTRINFSSAFSHLAAALYFFSLLYAAPLTAKIPFPDPHNFIQRKYEVLLGASYALFCISYTVLLLRLFYVHVLENASTKRTFWAFTCVFFALYFSLSLWMNRANAPTGDEPIYLLTAHSLAYDADLDLRGNYDNKDYRKFFPGELKSQEIEHNGALVSYHPVLISAVIAPAYYIFGRQGVSVMIAVICALIVALIFLLGEQICADKKTAFLTAVFSGLSLPLIMFSNQICADTISALLITAAFYMIYSGKGGGILPAFTAGLIIWAHPRNIPVYAVMLALGTVMNRKDLKKMAVFLAVNAAVLGALLAFNYVTYGTIMPRQTQADIPLSRVFSFNIGGILGLIFDKEFGLLIYTPLFILYPSAFTLLYKKNRQAALWCMAFLLPYYGMISSWSDWRGGGGASPRFLLQVLPFIIIPFLTLAAALKNGGLKKMLMPLFYAGLAMSAILSCIPWFRWSKGLGENWVFKFISAIIKINLNELLPSYWTPDTNAFLKTIIIVIIAAALNIYVLKRPEK